MLAIVLGFAGFVLTIHPPRDESRSEIQTSSTMKAEGFINNVFLETKQMGKQKLPETATLREGPSSNEKEIQILPKGHEITVVSEHGNWVKVETYLSN